VGRALAGRAERPVRAIIAPHAGYTYSGQTAGKGFAEIAGPFRRVVLIGPSHTYAFHGISVAPYSHYRTPLGDVPVDREGCDALLASCPFACELTAAHHREHALEVELPFIQTRWPEARIVPIVCGQIDWEDAEALAGELRNLWDDPDTLFVISSDFTHYGEAFGYTPAADPEELDRGAIDTIVAKRGFTEYIDRTGATVCGARPIATLLKLVTAESASLVHYSNSAAITGDHSHVVGYASIIFEERLSAADRDTLLRLARSAIIDRDALPPHRVSDALAGNGSCFVSLHKAGELRGCIGSIKAYQPLVENVMRNARAAAYEDRRFPPVTSDEIPELHIEISYLTPAERIAGVAEFELGRHGIILEQGRRRAVFLPQVPLEQAWDVTTTLEYLSRKAGLESDAWRDKASRFSVFETLCFGE
jgi:AmmeMemoRadiSam system protein B/AmmeMemoRadiSam system protein A